MWAKRGYDSHGDCATGATGQQAGTPGKRTLSEAVDSGPNVSPVQRKASGSSSTDVVAEAQRGVAGNAQALPHGQRIQALFGHHDVTVESGRT